MSPKLLLGLPLVFALTASATGQDTRAFPEAGCKYTLPSPDWEWLDPQVVPNNFGKTLVAARSENGIAFILIWNPLPPNEKPGSRAFEGFEKGFLETSKAKKLAGTESVFRGIPTYQLDAELPNGSGVSMRIMHANKSLYMFQAINESGPLAKADADSVLRGFDFTAEPEPVVFKQPGEEVAFAVGRFIGMAVCLGAVIVAVLGVVYLVARLTGGNVRRS